MLKNTLLLLSLSLLFTACAERGYKVTVTPSTQTITAQTSIDLRTTSKKSSQKEISKMKKAVQKEQVAEKKKAKAQEVQKIQEVQALKETKAKELKASEEKRIQESKVLEETKAKKHKALEEKRINDAKALEETKRKEAKALEKKRIQEAKALEETKAKELKALQEKRLNDAKALEKKRIQEAKALKETKAKERKALEEKKAREDQAALKAKKISDYEEKRKQKAKALKEKELREANLRKETKASAYAVKSKENKSKIPSTEAIVFQPINKTYHNFGNSEIHGHVIYLDPTGKETHLKQTKIYLLPRSTKLDYWYDHYYLKNKSNKSLSKTIGEYQNATTLNLDRNFAFYGVAAGNYYVIIESDYPSRKAKNKKVYIAKQIKVEKYKKVMTVFSKKL